MSTELWRSAVARLIGAVALACGIVGLVAGLADREWKLGVTGWFTGGALVALLAIMLILDEYTERRRRA